MLELRGMLLISLFSWWYQDGWALVVKSFRKRTTDIIESFSVTMLLRTLFSPWRRIISYPDKNLAANFYALLDNIISRMVGFSVRLMVLIGAALILVISLIITLVELVLWPLIPPLIVFLLVYGIFRL